MQVLSPETQLQGTGKAFADANMVCYEFSVPVFIG